MEDNVKLGCAQYLIAYCLAAYGISVFGLDSDYAGSSFGWFLFAPFVLPPMLLLGWLFVGNSELPADPKVLTWGLVIFLTLFAAAVVLVRKCLKCRWLALSTGAALVLYLAFAAYRLA